MFFISERDAREFLVHCNFRTLSVTGSSCEHQRHDQDNTVLNDTHSGRIQSFCHHFNCQYSAVLHSMPMLQEGYANQSHWSQQLSASACRRGFTNLQNATAEIDNHDKSSGDIVTGNYRWWSPGAACMMIGSLSSTEFDWWCSVNLGLEPWDSHQMWAKQASLISKVLQRYRVFSKRSSLQVLLRIRAIMFPWTKPHFPRLWGSLQGCNHQGACREGFLTLRVNAATSVSLSQLIWLDGKCVEVQALMAEHEKHSGPTLPFLAVIATNC